MKIFSFVPKTIVAALVPTILAVAAQSANVQPLFDRQQYIYNSPDNPLSVTGTITGGPSDTNSTGNTLNSATLNAAYVVSPIGGQAELGFSISGLTASGATLTLEGSAADGTTFSAINEISPGAGQLLGSTITADGNYYINSGGRVKVRLRISVVGTGTITIASFLSSASSRISIMSPIPPSQNGIGNVGGKTVSVCVTPTVTASNSYGINYVVGGLLTFANAFTSTGTGILQGVTVTMKDQETSGFTFIPFTANPTNTTWTDAAVAAINAADVTKVRSPVPLAINTQLAATLFSVQYAYGLGLPMAPSTTSLYGVLLANAALTNQFAGASDVQVCVKLLDDE